MTPAQITSAAPGFACNTETSSVCPFNCNGTRLLLLASHPPSTLDAFALFTGDGVFERNLPIGASTRPRWSRQSPNLFTYIDRMVPALRLYDASNHQSTLIHQFEEYASIDDRGEADTATDGSRVLAGMLPNGTVEVFVYSMKDGKGALYPQFEPFDGLKLPPNRMLLSRADGVWILGVDRQLTKANGHAAVGRHLGRDILLWVAASDPAINQNAVYVIDIASGEKRFLTKFPWAYAMHISTCDKDFCLVSLYSSDRDYKCQIWKVPLDGWKAECLVSDTGGIIRGTKPEDYTGQPRASLSRDGSKCVYNVDDGTTVNVAMLRLDNNGIIMPKESDNNPDYGTRIDYSSYAGKSVFTMVPRADGAVDIFERKL